MEKLREHLGSDGLPAKAAVKRLATDAALTTGELRDFVRNLKGRSPQEVIDSGDSAWTAALQWTVILGNHSHPLDW